MGNFVLDSFGLPRISGLNELSQALRLSPALLYRLITFHDKYYYRFEVPKKNGSKRTIKCPSREMKAAQAWILRNILSKLKISEHATAFYGGASILENAQRHVRHLHLLRYDLENYFDSIHHYRIVKIFTTCGYSFETARLLTALCTCDGCLPQGGVTSPCLSNLVTVMLDKRIAGLVCSKQIEYTRYADDLIFSSSNIVRLSSTRKYLEKIIIDEGFKINSQKTRFSGPGSRKKITGLILGDGRVGVGTNVKRMIRAKIHSYATKTLAEEERLSARLEIEGWLAYLKSVDKKRCTSLTKYALDVTSKYNLPPLQLRYPNLPLSQT